MTEAAQALVRLRDEAMGLIRATPELAAFAPLPERLVAVDKPARAAPGLAKFTANPGKTIAKTEAFTNAAVNAAPFLYWRQSYTEKQVGADFLAHYGWTELWGPTGHFECEGARAFVAFWGPNLYYDWHHHEAEEIYFLATGAADFQAKGLPDATVRTGETRLHSSNQPHATTIRDEPILTLVLWRGSGLTQLAYMPPKPAS